MTLGIGEPFTTTITVSLYFALIISLPVILYELYGFVLPALSPTRAAHRRAAADRDPVPVRVGVPFGYFVVLPAAVRFFVNFNTSEFNVLVQANQYYRFAATMLLAMGLVFQVPVAILGATRVGIVTPTAAAQEPPLRDRGLRGRGRLPARRRGDAAAGDGTAVCAV